MARKGLLKSTQRIAESLLGIEQTHRDQVNSLRNGGDSDIEQIENDFKDPRVQL